LRHSVIVKKDINTSLHHDNNNNDIDNATTRTENADAGQVGQHGLSTMSMTSMP